MKSKSPLVMLEQLIMILVFALAAALCLQAFALADGQSKNSAARDIAMLEVQRAAEIIKHCGGDITEAAAILECEAGENGLEYKADGYSIRAEHSDSPEEYLGTTRVWAENEAGEHIFEIELGWQRGGAA